jgi:HlyD family secretion protein
MEQQKHSRFWISALVLTILILGLGYSFWPVAIKLDTEKVYLGSLTITIDEQAKTRVHDSFFVSMPVQGRLIRVEVEPGDRVIKQQSLLFRVSPGYASLLDDRSKREASANLASAKASLQLAQADEAMIRADIALTEADYQRVASLRQQNMVSSAEFDHAKTKLEMAKARIVMKQSLVNISQAAIDKAHALLQRAPLNGLTDGTVLAIHAPASGKILNVLQESETVLQAGTPVIELGDVEQDLEVVVELLSTDSVQVSEGDPVEIINWGGAKPLLGKVKRIEPSGYTKFSALGVEEQRVLAIVELTSSQSEYQQLEHNYRVDVRISIWHKDNLLLARTSALFRHLGQWAVFTLIDGRAVLTPVTVHTNNASQAYITEGLEAGDLVILYPPANISDGTRIKANSD